MIGYIKGQLLQKKPNVLLVDVHGVGYEIAYANHERHMRVLQVAFKDTSTSAMLSGAFDVHYYRDIGDLRGLIEAFLESLA